jgi:hypothetical protein
VTWLCVFSLDELHHSDLLHRRYCTIAPIKKNLRTTSCSHASMTGFLSPRRFELPLYLSCPVVIQLSSYFGSACWRVSRMALNKSCAHSHQTAVPIPSHVLKRWLPQLPFPSNLAQRRVHFQVATGLQLKEFVAVCILLMQAYLRACFAQSDPTEHEGIGQQCWRWTKEYTSNTVASCIWNNRAALLQQRRRFGC